MSKKHKEIDVKSEVKEFFDFYAINELYLRCGGFREQGYPTYSVYVNERIYNKIMEKYEEIVDTFYVRIYKAIVISISSEIHHFPANCCDHYSPVEPQFYEDLRGKSGIPITSDVVDEAKKDVEKYIDIVYALFSVPQWTEAYGGKRWADATQILKDAKHVKTHRDKVYWCDRVLDLYHNTGHLLNKTSFKCLSIHCIQNKNGQRITPLNFRMKSRTIVDFIPYLSFPVQKLVIPRKLLLQLDS